MTYVNLPLFLHAFADRVELADLLHGIPGRGVLPDQHKILHHCKIPAARGLITLEFIMGRVSVYIRVVGE